MEISSEPNQRFGGCRSPSPPATRIPSPSLFSVRCGMSNISWGFGRTGAGQADLSDLVSMMHACSFLFRATDPGHFKRLVRDRQFVTECLQHYNYMHPVGHHCCPSLPSVTAYMMYRYKLLLWLGPTNTQTTCSGLDIIWTFEYKMKPLNWIDHANAYPSQLYIYLYIDLILCIGWLVRTPSMNQVLVRWSNRSVGTMVLPGFMVTLWHVASALAASPFCLLHGLSSFLSSCVAVVSQESLHAHP